MCLLLSRDSAYLTCLSDFFLLANSPPPRPAPSNTVRLGSFTWLLNVWARWAEVKVEFVLLIGEYSAGFTECKVGIADFLLTNDGFFWLSVLYLTTVFKD